jgi:hypothetical protein
VGARVRAAIAARARDPAYARGRRRRRRRDRSINPARAASHAAAPPLLI